jgi:hypothetical protein
MCSGRSVVSQRGSRRFSRRDRYGCLRQVRPLGQEDKRSLGRPLHAFVM